MPKVCIWKPKRTNPRVIKPQDVARILCACKKNGFNDTEIMFAIRKKCNFEPCEYERIRVAVEIIRASAEAMAVVIFAFTPAILSLRSLVAGILRLPGFRQLSRLSNLTNSRLLTGNRLELAVRAERDITAQVELIEKIVGPRTGGGGF